MKTVLGAILLFMGPLFSSSPATTELFQEDKQRDKEDEALIVKIKEAVGKGIAVEKIEDFVGKKATINTLRKVDRESIARAEFDIDSDEKGEIMKIAQFREAKYVVYWVRTVKSRNPKIVGVAWTEKMEAKLFFAIIFPPT